MRRKQIAVGLCCLFISCATSLSEGIRFTFEFQAASTNKGLPFDARFAGTAMDYDPHNNSGLGFRVVTDRSRSTGLVNVVKVPIREIKVHYFDTSVYKTTNEVERFLLSAFKAWGYTTASVHWASVTGPPVIEATPCFENGKTGKWLIFSKGQHSAFQDFDDRWWFTSWPVEKRPLEQKINPPTTP